MREVFRWDGGSGVGAKFIIDRRCTVKTSMTLTGLIEGLKHQGVLRRVTELAAAGGVPAGDIEREVQGNLSIQDLHEQAALLQQHRVTCRQCPASLHGHVGGCIGYVPYPLSEGMEYLLWVTAVRALEGRMPEPLLPAAQAFAQRAQRIERTPFADGMRARGDLLGPKPRVHASGMLWRKARLTSSQVLDAFFVNGVLAGEDLRIHEGFVAAALAVAEAMEPAMSTDEKRRALLEDVAPYVQVHELLCRGLEQGLGVYVWP